jgi:hypothetical protein
MPDVQCLPGDYFISLSGTDEGLSILRQGCGNPNAPNVPWIGGVGYIDNSCSAATGLGGCSPERDLNFWIAPCCGLACTAMGGTFEVDLLYRVGDAGSLDAHGWARLRPLPLDGGMVGGDFSARPSENHPATNRHPRANISVRICSGIGGRRGGSSPEIVSAAMTATRNVAADSHQRASRGKDGSGRRWRLAVIEMRRRYRRAPAPAKHVTAEALLCAPPDSDSTHRGHAAWRSLKRAHATTRTALRPSSPPRSTRRCGR